MVTEKRSLVQMYSVLKDVGGDGMMLPAGAHAAIYKQGIVQFWSVSFILHHIFVLLFC
jgi:hypothetical protein